MTYRIPLVKDTITKNDLQILIEWLSQNPRLTKGEKTLEFENAWSKWQGRKYSVFVNSGSSANLAMLYSLHLSGRLKNKKIIIPAISWVTTVAPVIQLGMEPIMCDSDPQDLGLHIPHLEKLVEEHQPSAIILVHVLGIPNKMEDILRICRENDVILLEDSCESMGSTYDGIKTGNFGLMSSFSTYYGHHFSTIEGGLINTDDEELYNILLSIRSHGWDRDLSEAERKRLREEEGVSEFRALYTFYYPGFNLRSTDLQAFIGIEQLKRLDEIVKRRNSNFRLYHSLIKNPYWKVGVQERCFISNFAYPIILPEDRFNKGVEILNGSGVEIRPLICGSIGEQPFWKKLGIFSDTPNARIVHHQGMYLPNNHSIKEEEILEISELINSLF